MFWSRLALMLRVWPTPDVNAGATRHPLSCQSVLRDFFLDASKQCRHRVRRFLAPTPSKCLPNIHTMLVLHIAVHLVACVPRLSRGSTHSLFACRGLTKGVREFAREKHTAVTIGWFRSCRQRNHDSRNAYETCRRWSSHRRAS